MKMRNTILPAVLATATILTASSSAIAGGGHYGNSGGYGHHNNHHGGGYGHGHRAFKICFYSRTNYRGHHYCESDYRTKHRVGHNWRHKIKSVKIHRNGRYGRHTPSIRLCNQYGGGGYCKTYFRGSPHLHEALYGHVYSYNISQ
ncbi:hypothetical protein [Lentilitoribacter sp. EG35]|uniref:hypothetical protein n=1 Tax=Lentilitoribacter sp. EG35 TaxID=3234192 RepID=UPI00345F6D77